MNQYFFWFFRLAHVALNTLFSGWENLGYPNVISNLKKGYYETLKYANCKWGFAEDCLEVYENCADHSSLYSSFSNFTSKQTEIN